MNRYARVLGLGIAMAFWAGCNRKDQIDYKVPKDTDAEIQLPMVILGSEKPASVKTISVSSNTDNRFWGEVKRSATDDSKGASLSIAIVKLSGNRVSTFGSSATTVSFGNTDVAKFSTIVKSPKAGKYAFRVYSSGVVLLRGDLLVTESRKKK
jgi:hypothetical protein